MLSEQLLGDFQGAMDISVLPLPEPCLVCGQLTGSSSCLGMGGVRASHLPRYPFGQRVKRPLKHFWASCRELLLGSPNSPHPTAAGFHGLGEDCASSPHAGAGSTPCKGWLVGLGTVLEQRGLFLPVRQKGPDKLPEIESGVKGHLLA